MKAHPQYDNLLLFDLLKNEEGVSHFSTTRKGGVSHGAYASLNTGNFSDDSPLHIHENRKIIARMFYMETSDFIIPHQTHGSNVLAIDPPFFELERPTAIETLYGVDAVVTNMKGIFLCVTTADCVPILLYDKAKGVVAAIHAGWRGTVGRIVENTVRTIVEQYQSSPSDIAACIGPAISQERYEVGEEVVEQFQANGFDLTIADVCYRNEATNKCHLNLKEINRLELLRLGLRDSNIEISDLCTYNNEEWFFSARRQSVHSGRMLSGIMLNEN